MRTLLIAAAAVIAVAGGMLVGALAASGGSSPSSASEQQRQRYADLWEIDLLEKNFHKATTRKNIDLMMSLYAPNATFTFAGTIAEGKKAIRQFWLTKSKAFLPSNRWISETPAYKVRITVNGDNGTLYFECHYLDAKTSKMEAVTAAEADVARINGRWLITNLAGASATLTP
ncbi:MAG TPA: nuclear transport factor 2 family protein [Gaiellaceae bacterium]|nr:nuclear transport factor 2 family protein [Gaiellaceae bacterium]